MEVLPRMVNGMLRFNIVLVDQEAWPKFADHWPTFVSELAMGKNSEIPKIFLLANPSISTRNVSTKAMDHVSAVIMKPLRASMLLVSLQRAMGCGDKDNCQNGGAPGLSLRGLLHGRQILVVDDNIVNLRVAAGALKKYGAEVTCADSGKKAIMMLKPPHKFDACFMDIQMPEIDGFEATRRIREMEANINDRIKHGEVCSEDSGNVLHWHVPILAMTADVIQATQEECLKCKMDGYVSKPFEGEQLYREVARFFKSNIKKTQ
ncbi:hypothetical protein HPP92_011467 [Vanilla planifolia]|nr:hypothetical protein HPP92_011467 [Vanilla planifolia]